MAAERNPPSITPGVPHRVAVLVGAFPLISETFILRHVIGLLGAGMEVKVVAESRPPAGMPVHPEMEQHDLWKRTHYLDLPEASSPWELPVWPLWGQSWVPGAATPVSNLERLTDALPEFFQCLECCPGFSLEMLNPASQGYRAASLSGLYRLRGLCESLPGCEMLHAHFGPVGDRFRFARRLLGAPLVVSFHGYDFCSVPREQGEDVYRHLFEEADAVTVNSQFARGRLLALGCPESKLHVWPMGVSLESFPFCERVMTSGEPVRFLTLARLVPVKGHETAIRAVALVHRRLPNVRYDIVGEGPERGRLEELICSLGLQQVVRLHGACDREQSREWLHRSHVFVLPSETVQGDQEAQGLVLQEAQATGMPVVATASGGIREGVADGQSGFLVPEKDPLAMAEILVSLATDPGSWGAMGRAGRDFVVGHFDEIKLRDRLMEVYELAREHFFRHRGNTGCSQA